MMECDDENENDCKSRPVLDDERWSECAMRGFEDCSAAHFVATLLGELERLRPAANMRSQLIADFSKKGDDRERRSILRAIESVDRRLRWRKGSECRVRSESDGLWSGGRIVGVRTDRAR